MSFSRILPFLTAISVAGQTPSAGPSPAGHHHDEPVTLDHFVTSASPFQRNQVELAQSTTVLSGTALVVRQQGTIGETLAAEPGMSATYFGPGSSRPIIRGLGGDRVRLLENSVATLDASVASPDHAVAVEPFLVERVEVVRGPASLLYGNSAIGGVVNVITHRIETEVPAERVRGGAEVRWGSAADEFSRGALLDVALVHAPEHAVVFHADAFRRTSEDLRIPGYAESASVRAAESSAAAEHGEAAPTWRHGRLPNSASDSSGRAAGLTVVTKAFHLGFSASGMDTRYGVPGHHHAHGAADEADAGGAMADGVRIDLQQRRTDIQGAWQGEAGALRGAKFKLGLANYRHDEVEPDGSVGTRFGNRGHDGRIELLHAAGTALQGAVGVQTSRSDFRVEGEEAFLPASLTDSVAGFVFEEIARGPVTWQAGARLERIRIAADGHSTRSQRDLSGSVGAVWRIDAAHSVAVSVVRTARSPNAQELFANGPHIGTGSYEIGEAGLGRERLLGGEISMRRRGARVTGSLTAFRHDFDGFIFERPTGESAIEEDGAWEIHSPGDPADHDGALPVFRYSQREARLWGGEFELLWHLHEAHGRQLDLKFAADFTRGRQGSEALPRIPAARFTTGAAWTAETWTAGAEVQYVGRQSRTAPNETPSGDYVLASAYATYAWSWRGVKQQFFARATNLANEEARPHTSRVRDLVPLPARAVTLGVRVTF